MNGHRNSPTSVEIAFLNSRGFAQVIENSWLFFKLGYIFDLSATNIEVFIDDVWRDRDYLKISKTM
jgi:hypothetical protein